MPWDNEGHAMEDFASGYRCGYCGSIGPCQHGLEGRAYETDAFDEPSSFDGLPEPDCWACGDAGCSYCAKEMK